MKVTANNRLIGIAVALIVMFLLTWLIPSTKVKVKPKQSQSIPVAAVPIGSSTSPNAPADATSTSLAVSSKSQAAMTKANTVGLKSSSDKNAERTFANNPAPAGTADTATALPKEQSARRPVQLPTGQKNARLQKRTAVPPSHRGAAASFYIQIASFGDLRDARKMRSMLRHKSIRAHIDHAAVNGHSYYRLRLGPYPTRKAAEMERRRMVHDGYKHAWVSH